MFLFSQLSTIASQSALGTELLSQAFKSAPTKPSSIDPQKEPILVETTDAFKTTEDKSPSIPPPDATKVFLSKFLIQLSPFSDHLPCQTLPEETFTQRQKSSSLPIEGDPVDVDTQTVESLVQQTIDGKKVICSVKLSATNMN